jgi:hypothetical protein
MFATIGTPSDRMLQIEPLRDPRIELDARFRHYR